MSDERRDADTGWQPDAVDRLGHALIRARTGDDLDPFFVKGHPAMAQGDDRLVRGCFYYALVVTPRVTALYDNQGAGGMCTMDPTEITAIWRTPELLGALGMDFDGLRDGTAFPAGSEVPAPLWTPSPDKFDTVGPTAPGDGSGTAPTIEPDEGVGMGHGTDGYGYHATDEDKLAAMAEEGLSANEDRDTTFGYSDFR